MDGGANSVRWPNKTSLTHSSSSKTTILHPSMDQRAFLGATGSSITCQGNWEESLPPICQVKGTQISVLPAVAHKPALVPLGCGLGPPGEHSLRQSPTDERVFVGVQVLSQELPAYH